MILKDFLFNLGNSTLRITKYKDGSYQVYDLQDMFLFEFFTEEDLLNAISKWSVGKASLLLNYSYD